ncbi:MAG TPA: hypothetical protein VFB45_20515 [Pseudolabrys sp.]|nr:hypothetical protein [Pseudolabrys sp.]
MVTAAAASVTAAATSASHSQSIGTGPSVSQRELRAVLSQGTALGVGPQIAAAGAASPMDLAELIDKALAKGAGDEDAANLALRAGLLLSEITRDRRDGTDFISTGPVPAATKYPYTPALKSEYADLFQRAKITASATPELTRAARFITSDSAKARYQEVESDTGVPWYVIGALHYREANLNFMGHLHNGDFLLAQTVHVPAKRPPKPWPPANVSDPRQLWRLSAKDALTDITRIVHDWKLQRMCYAFEAYNGFGCRDHGIKSPYLWNYTNWYTRGGFPTDHHFDPNYQSKQAGVVAIINELKKFGASGVNIQIEA